MIKLDLKIHDWAMFGLSHLIRYKNNDSSDLNLKNTAYNVSGLFQMLSWELTTYNSKFVILTILQFSLFYKGSHHPLTIKG